MQDITELRFHSGSKEELLPDFTPEFPYMASRVAMDRYPGRAAAERPPPVGKAQRQGQGNDGLYPRAFWGKVSRVRPCRGGIFKRTGVLSGLPGVPSHHPGRVHEKLPAPTGVPPAAGKQGVRHRDRPALRSGQQQLFRQDLPGHHGLHPVGVPPQMAGY